MTDFPFLRLCGSGWSQGDRPGSAWNPSPPSPRRKPLAPDPSGIGGLTGLRPRPPTPEKIRGTPIAAVVYTFFRPGAPLVSVVATCFDTACDSKCEESFATSPRVSTWRVIRNAKRYLLPSPIATVVATCFDITSDMNCEVSFFASKIASQVSLGDRKDIESYPSSHFLGSKVGRNHRPRASGALPEPRGRNR